MPSKDYERIKIIFIENEYEIKLEAKKEFIAEFEEIALDNLPKAIKFLDENKDKWKMLKDYHLEEMDFNRVIHGEDDFKKHYKGTKVCQKK